jgi:hypothetical protein
MHLNLLRHLLRLVLPEVLQVDGLCHLVEGDLAALMLEHHHRVQFSVLEADEKNSLQLPRLLL